MTLFTLEQKIEDEKGFREAADNVLQGNLGKLQKLYRDTSCLEGGVVIGFDHEGNIICNDLIELNIPKWCPCFSVDELNAEYDVNEPGVLCDVSDSWGRSKIGILTGHYYFGTSWNDSMGQGFCNITGSHEMPDQI